MLKAIGTTSYGEHELGDELLGAIATIAAGLWQRGGGKGSVKSEMVEHPFHQPHAAPGGDFLVGKTALKFPHCPTLKSRSLNLAENTLTGHVINNLC